MHQKENKNYLNSKTIHIINEYFMICNHFQVLIRDKLFKCVDNDSNDDIYLRTCTFLSLIINESLALTCICVHVRKACMAMTVEIHFSLSSLNFWHIYARFNEFLIDLFGSFFCNGFRRHRYCLINPNILPNYSCNEIFFSKIRIFNYSRL